MAGAAALTSACGARRPDTVGPPTTITTTTAPPATTSTAAPPATTPTTAPPATTPTTAPPTTTTTSVPVATTTTIRRSATTTSASTTTTAPTTATTARAPTEADWKTLARGLSGRLSRPGRPGYSVDSELYDPRFDGTRPAAIAHCANASDVARSITFAREHGLALAARSGGHSYGGYSTTTGLVVDVSRMAGVTLSSRGASATSATSATAGTAGKAGKAGNVATVGAGAQLIDVYSGLAARGVSIPAGSCPTVGIAGLALGGGIGVMDRLHGLTCDNIVGLKLVTAAGDIVDADAGTNPDLYWACRGGGGGNFGVVTGFRFATFPTADISLFSATWPWAAAADLVPAWLEWSSSGPDELWSNCLLEASPGSPAPHVHVGGVWAGAVSDAQVQLDRLVNAVGPAAGLWVGDAGFEAAMYIEAGCQGRSQAACHVAGKYPGGTLPRMVGLAKSDIFNAPLGAAGVRALLAGVEERQAQRGPGGVILDSWGGAISRVAPGATAFVHRRALASAQYVAHFPAGVTKGRVRAATGWMNSWYASMRPYVGGEAYQNYIDPALPHWARAYYGANLARLERIKAKWDPDGVWRFAQSIPTAAPGPDRKADRGRGRALLRFRAAGPG
jgi:FAD/FMN-containing dehydrogenase